MKTHPKSADFSAQKMHSDCGPDLPPGVFQSDDINRNRVTLAAGMSIRAAGNHRYSIGVDPQSAHKPTRGRRNGIPDLTRKWITGIVVASVAPDGDFYVWADASMSGSPADWTGAAAITLNKHAGGAAKTTLVVGARSVAETLHVASPDFNINIIKAPHPEQISIMYSQNRIHHIDTLSELEDDMEWFPCESPEHPTRVYALMLALISLNQPVPRIDCIKGL